MSLHPRASCPYALADRATHRADDALRDARIAYHTRWREMTPQEVDALVSALARAVDRARAALRAVEAMHPGSEPAALPHVPADAPPLVLIRAAIHTVGAVRAAYQAAADIMDCTDEQAAADACYSILAAAEVAADRARPQ